MSIDFANFMKNERAKRIGIDGKKMTQFEFSQIVGISDSEISGYETGGNPSMGRLIMVTEALGYDLVLVKRGSKEWLDARREVTEDDVRKGLEGYGLSEANINLVLGLMRSMQEVEKEKPDEGETVGESPTA